MANGSISEELTRQFYEWEFEGRGCVCWGFPLELEPPFRPFQYHRPVLRVADDSRRHTWLSAFVERHFGSRRTSPVMHEEATAEDSVDFQWLPAYAGELDTPDVYSLRVPEKYAVSKTLLAQMVINLSSVSYPLGFEYIGNSASLDCRLSCQPEDSRSLRNQIGIHLPGVTLKTVTHEIDLSRKPGASGIVGVFEYGLQREFMRPIRTFPSLDIDPLLGIVGVLDNLCEGEFGAYQVLWQPCVNPWAQSILRSVTDAKGGNIFVNAPDMLSLAKEKIAQPLFAAVVRLAAYAPQMERMAGILYALEGALSPFNRPGSNGFVRLDNDEYGEFSHLEDVTYRRSQRSGMILNTDELIGLVHPPGPNVHAVKLERDTRRTKQAPAMPKNAEIVLGENVHAGEVTEVTLNADQRSKHMHVIGASGTGKSTFLLNLILQDMEDGRGLCVLEPHGDLIDEILLHIPEHRREDVIVFDPADAEYPIGCNVLAAHSDLERNLLASDLVAVFQRLATSWGDQMTTVFSNAILAFLESERGGTLADLRRFLVEKEYRAAFLKTVKDENVVYFWQREYPLITGRPQTPILTRLDAFLRSKLVRNIVAQRENRLDFAGMMNEGKIFLARLAQGAIGEENAYLLGSLLVAKMHQAALSRQEISESERRPFYLYIDEFHHFITPSMASILTGVRKFRLGLVLAHQELRQLERRDAEVAHAVLANPYARICFRVGEADARKLSEGFSAFASEDFLNLGTGEALARFEQARNDFNLLTYPPPTPNPDASTHREQTLNASRATYGRPRRDVEAEFSESMAKAASPVESTSTVTPAARAASPAEVVDAAPEAPVPHEPKEPSAKRTAVEPVAQKSTPKPVRVLKPAAMGKGGHDHRSMQQLIKRWAEGMGYKATIEHQLDSGGSVDVALKKEAAHIACEITVTTTPKHELENLRKCLDDEFTHIVAVSQDAAKLQRIRALAIETMNTDDLARIHFFEAQDFFRFVQELEAKKAASESTVRGYRVKVNYKNVPENEQRAAKDIISKTVLDAMKKRKHRGEEDR